MKCSTSSNAVIPLLIAFALATVPASAFSAPSKFKDNGTEGDGMDGIGGTGITLIDVKDLALRGDGVQVHP
ncbi:MAG: hypothetical protein QNJ78_12800 [Gammaproteobacteria bacterium]|nr:hypothetical protein [Gammaproteobacteria bacterium]